VKWPKIVKILGRTFTVTEVSPYEGHELAEIFAAGTASIEHKEIILSDVLIPEDKLDTLIHEMVEIAMVILGEPFDHVQFARMCTIVVSMLLENNLLVLPED